MHLTRSRVIRTRVRLATTLPSFPTTPGVTLRMPRRSTSIPTVDSTRKTFTTCACFQQVEGRRLQPLPPRPQLLRQPQLRPRQHRHPQLQLHPQVHPAGLRLRQGLARLRRRGHNSKSEGVLTREFASSRVMHVSFSAKGAIHQEPGASPQD